MGLGAMGFGVGEMATAGCGAGTAVDVGVGFDSAIGSGVTMGSVAVRGGCVQWPPWESPFASWLWRFGGLSTHR